MWPLTKILFPEHQQSYISRNKAFLCTQSLNYLCTQNIIECALALASIFATSYTQLWALMCNPQFCHTWALIVSNKLANYEMSWKKFWIVSVVNLTGRHTRTYILYSRILSRKVFALQSKRKKIKKKGARIAGVRWETSMQLMCFISSQKLFMKQTRANARPHVRNLFRACMIMIVLTPWGRA